jgi:hypothetical protein
VPSERSGSGRRGTIRRLGTIAVLIAGLAGAIGLLEGPGSGHAPASTPSPTVASRVSQPLGSMFQDDRLLLYSSTPTVVRTLDTLRALGVDRLRVTVLWSALAPASGSRIAPAGFDGTNPAAYPSGVWAPYDRLLLLARARGLGVDFDLTAPGPLWAMRPGAPIAREANHFEPSAAAFERFVIAIGRRYSGRYVPPRAQAPLSRVDYWSVWNEPNQPGWLAPQTAGLGPRAGPGLRAGLGPRAGPGLRAGLGPRAVLESARLYRGYVDGAFAALRRTGHGRDTFLIGELAPEGDERRGASLPVPPIRFLRALYCTGSSYRPLIGAAATALGCPAGGPSPAFVAAHPGLFAATGFAHHPYSFFLAPQAPMPDVNFAPLSELGRLEHGLDAIFSAYSVSRRLPIYLTEYGYETNPPNPFRGVSPATQAAYLNQAEYMAWSDPRVRTLSQFLLYDSAPDAAYPRGSIGYWSTFQTGLAFLSGKPKPSFFTYALPIFVPDPSFARGTAVTVWGMLRLAPDGTEQRALVQWRSSGGRTDWRTLEFVTTANPSGVLLVRVRLPGSGAVRLAWRSPRGVTDYSRAFPVRLIPSG